MPHKRPSLAEISREDQELEYIPKSETGNQTQPMGGSGHEFSKKVGPEESLFPKSEFIKMSVTVPPDMYESLEDIARLRRRAKRPHTLSELAREAFEIWLAEHTARDR